MHRMIFCVIAVALFGCVNCDWQNYVDDQLVGEGFAKAAIVNKDSGAIVANSAGFNPNALEIKALKDGYASPSSIFAKGLTLKGIKYITIKADEGSIYGKKGAGGAICVLTQSFILIGIYDEHLQPGNAATIVEKLGDFIREQGY